MIFTAGEYKPFFGESTSTGIENPEVKLDDKDIFTMKLNTLLTLYKWTIPSGPIPGHISISELIEFIITRYTGKPVSDFLPFLPGKVKGKTMQHHLRSNQFRPAIVPNTLTNIYTWFKGHPFSPQEITASGRHPRFNFLEILCHTCSCIFTNMWLSGRVPVKNEYWAVTTDCGYCSGNIKESDIGIKILNLEDVQLFDLFLPAQKQIKNIIRDTEAFDPEKFYCPEVDLENIPDNVAASTVAQHMIDVCWTKIISLLDTKTGHHISTDDMSRHKNFNFFFQFSFYIIVLQKTQMSF